MQVLHEKVPSLKEEGQDGMGFPTTRWVGESDYKKWKSYGNSLRRKATKGELNFAWGRVPQKYYRRHPGIVPHAAFFHGDSVPIVYYFMMRELGYGQEDAYKHMLKGIIGGPGSKGTDNFTKAPGHKGTYLHEAWTSGLTKVPPGKNANYPPDANQQVSAAGDGSSLPPETEQEKTLREARDRFKTKCIWTDITEKGIIVGYRKLHEDACAMVQGRSPGRLTYEGLAQYLKGANKAELAEIFG